LTKETTIRNLGTVKPLTSQLAKS